MIILGIDPGLNITGYGLINDDNGAVNVIEAGVLRSKAAHPLERRLCDLYEGLNSLISEFVPDAVSVEEVYSHYNHPRTAVIMGHARGVLFLAAGKADIPVYSYSATRIKKSLTGSGRATKEQVSRMICSVLNCDTSSVPADVSDALAAALCHYNVKTHSYIQ